MIAKTRLVETTRWGLWSRLLVLLISELNTRGNLLGLTPWTARNSPEFFAPNFFPSSFVWYRDPNYSSNLCCNSDLRRQDFLTFVLGYEPLVLATILLSNVSATRKCWCNLCQDRHTKRRLVAHRDQRNESQRQLGTARARAGLQLSQEDIKGCTGIAIWRGKVGLKQLQQLPLMCGVC